MAKIQSMTNVEVVFLNICVCSFAHCPSIYNNKTQVNLSDYQQTDGENVYEHNEIWFIH